MNKSNDNWVFFYRKDNKPAIFPCDVVQNSNILSVLVDCSKVDLQECSLDGWLTGKNIVLQGDILFDEIDGKAELKGEQFSDTVYAGSGEFIDSNNKKTPIDWTLEKL